MLDDFLLSNRDAILTRVKARVAFRKSPKPTEGELTHGIPVFLDQLGEALRLQRSSDAVDHRELEKSATSHGRDLMRMGLTIGQVVHDYGDVCQVLTELATEQNVLVSTEEFRTLNLCLDDAIAGAVTEFSHRQGRAIEDRGTERLGVFAHELRNLVGTAMLSFDIIRTGHVAPGGSTGVVLARSLRGLRDLIDRSLAHVRLDAGIEHFERISVADLLEELEVSALIQAEGHGVQVAVRSVDRTVTVDGDRQILAGALANLLQNAFKFTPKGGGVSLTAIATPARVLLEVEDECGGLPPGTAEDLFRPYEQRGADRSGMGLGLSICLRAAKAHRGELRVRDLPGKGCVFTLDLPRKPPTPLSMVGGKKSRAGSPGATGSTSTQGSGTPKA